ncbi:hypothetical protein DSAG12_01287 [Promethearchaeum syntrophicum]|uniref:Uncharacterized protein n=1 Tax=Promethearchaeum syntrophicum TaxID=2594042 RepID=A0A5B9D8X0_9ARCH|nr:hypothetical protein [Candidatus Prometheoarchaeum syntrophicum]QEE15461.1 hypothetical protein DSAG12_01287 [Candidatus Prometheoarchaeum syntrophicum]
MTEIQKKNRIKKRISLAISEEELTRWELNNNRESLSAFIREAVNEYIKIRNPGQYSNLMDELLQQNSEQSDHIEKIERDLIEIRAAIAKKDIIPDSDQMENQILNYIKRKLKKEDITDEIKRIFENYKDTL